MTLRRFARLGPALLAAACARPAPPAPAPPPAAVAPVDACADARARMTLEPDLMVDRLPVPVVMKPAAFQRVPARALRKDGSAEIQADVVVDTLGRADMKTFKVVAASNAWFATDLRRVLPQWRFSPAELGGCKVPRTYHFSAGIRPRAAAPARRPAPAPRKPD
ncbi:MAG TPA: hypothetical protein VEA99_01920 [Gemmatimonadaceae bacterium]|nr:hypothetical protein [Gemmatimonadaceae bacterium]